MSKPLTFGIDIDGTWDQAPHLFLALCLLLEQMGHRAVIVTGSRQPIEKLERLRLATEGRVHYQIVTCEGMLKKKACEALGIHIDIWIDNEPGTIEECRKLQESEDDTL
jgi:hypothetical protein